MNLKRKKIVDHHKKPTRKKVYKRNAPFSVLWPRRRLSLWLCFFVDFEKERQRRKKSIQRRIALSSIFVNNPLMAQKPSFSSFHQIFLWMKIRIFSGAFYFCFCLVCHFIIKYANAGKVKRKITAKRWSRPSCSHSAHKVNWIFTSKPLESARCYRLPVVDATHFTASWIFRIFLRFHRSVHPKIFETICVFQWQFICRPKSQCHSNEF